MAVPDSTNCGCNFVAAGPGKIRRTTIDAFIQSQALERVDLIKVDIEGSEIAFLEGAAETIAKFRPRLMIEVNSLTLQRFGKTSAELVGLLGKYRYQLATATTIGGFKPLDRLPVYGEEPNVYAFPID